MDPDSARLDDPRLPLNRVNRDHPHRVSGKGRESLPTHVPARPKNNDACSGPRRKSENVAEIQIQGNEATLLHSAHVVNGVIRSSLEILASDSLCIVTCTDEDLEGSGPKILVKLELHGRWPVGIST